MSGIVAAVEFVPVSSRPIRMAECQAIATPIEDEASQQAEALAEPPEVFAAEPLD